MPLPNFLIVGAVKCGTSTLRDYLKQHEEIYIAPSALQFFNKEQNFQRGMKWYERQFRARSHHRAIGEKTPTYCFDKQAPERISQNLPAVKLIWILRDPVKRAYSNYWHKMRRGGECIEFEAVVEECLKQERAGEPVRSNILERGRYAEQVKRYLEFFPREDMMFLSFEEFFSKPTRILPKVFEFLGVSAGNPIRPQLSWKRGYMPRSAPLVWHAKKLFKKSIAYEFVRSINRQPQATYPPMSDKMKEMLRRYYAPHNRDLSDLLGLDLGAWDLDASRKHSGKQTPSANSSLAPISDQQLFS